MRAVPPRAQGHHRRVGQRATRRETASRAHQGQTAGNKPDNVTVSSSGSVVLGKDGGGSTDAFDTGSRVLGLGKLWAAFAAVALRAIQGHLLTYTLTESPSR